MSRTFDGNDKLEVATALVSAAPFTIICWAHRTTATTVAQTLAGVFTNGSTSNFHRLSLSNAHLLTAQSDNGTTSGSSGHTFSDTTGWHHVAGVWASATSRRCFFDGTGDTASTTSRAPTVDITKLGVRGTDTQFLDEARLAHVAIWNIALSDAEVAGLAGGDNPLAVQAGNLVAYWPMVDDDITDHAGANDLTNTGSAHNADNPTVDDPPGGGSDTPLAVDAASLVLEGQNIGLIFEEAYVAAVEHGQLAIEGQQIPFILSQPYTDAQLVLQGQDIQMLTVANIAVDSGSLALAGQDVGLHLTTATAVEGAQLALSGQVIGLLATGLPALGSAIVLRRRRR